MGLHACMGSPLHLVARAAPFVDVHIPVHAQIRHQLSQTTATLEAAQVGLESTAKERRGLEKRHLAQLKELNKR